MNLKMLPPSIVAVLGLACAHTQSTVHPCVGGPFEPSTENLGVCLSMIHQEPADPEDGSQQEPADPEDGSQQEPPVGPALPPPASGPDDAPDASDGATVAAPPVATRHEALERVLSRNVLPADVAARLRG